MKIVRGYKVKLYPTHAQKKVLVGYLGACRFVYNHMLQKRSMLYREKGEQFPLRLMSRELTRLRVEHTWLRITRDPLEQSLRNLEAAYSNFFRKRARHPVFKRKDEPAQSMSKSTDWKIIGKRVRFVKGLEIRFRGTFPKRAEATITISRDSVGDWFASTIAREEREPAKLKGSVGLDMGLKHLVTTSNGEKYENPRVLGGLLGRVRHASKALSRTKKGGRNRAKKRRILARTYRKVERVRRNGLHQISNAIVGKNHAMIAIEDLNVKGLMKNRRLSRAISDASWGELLRQLTYKQEWVGGKVVKIGRFYPSSKTCSGCGFLLGSLQLSEREWRCPGCGIRHDRDINAAKNILKQAEEQLGVDGKALARKRVKLVPVKHEPPLREDSDNHLTL